MQTLKKTYFTQPSPLAQLKVVLTIILVALISTASYIFIKTSSKWKKYSKFKI